MLNRMLMTTVAVLALAVPAAAQDATKPLEQEQEQAQQTLQQQGETAPSGQDEQQAQPVEPQAEEGEAEQPPAMAEEPVEEEPPAMAEEPVEEPPAMAEEPVEEPPAMAEEPVEEPPAMAEESTTPPAEMTFIEVQDDAQFLANDEVIGKSVVNANDEDVGTIADLVMDREQKLVGVVLSIGGFLGIGEKWVAVPIEQIDFPTADEPARLQLQVTSDQLKNAPDFVTKETAQAQQEAEQAQQQMQQATPPAPTTTQ